MSVLVNKSINIFIGVAVVFVLFFYGVHSVYADHFTDDYIESERDKLKSQFEAGLFDGEEPPPREKLLLSSFTRHMQTLPTMSPLTKTGKGSKNFKTLGVAG